MTFDPEKIKEALREKAGTLESAARKMSNNEYSVSVSSLSKVINGKRKTLIIRVRIARLIGLPVKQIFGN